MHWGYFTSECPVAAEEAASLTSKSASYLGMFLAKPLLDLGDPRMRDHGRSGEWKCSEILHLDLQDVYAEKQRRSWAPSVLEYAKRRESFSSSTSLQPPLQHRKDKQGDNLDVEDKVSLSCRKQSRAVTVGLILHLLVLAVRCARRGVFGWKTPSHPCC